MYCIRCHLTNTVAEIVYNVLQENYKKSKFKTYKSFASVTVTGSHKLVHKLAIISAKKLIRKLISLNGK